LIEKKRDRILRAIAFGAIYASDTNEGIRMAIEIAELGMLGDLEECPHQIGRQYGKAKCQPIAKNIEFTEISVVDSPKDPRCRVFDLLIIKKENHQRIYEWYGFEVNTEMDRFRSIQRALEGNFIPEKAAFYFGKFFSINLVGNTSYQ